MPLTASELDDDVEPSPLIEGDRLIVVRAGRLEELAWSGRTLRQLVPTGVKSAYQWDPESVVYVDLHADVWVHDLTTHRNRRLRKVPRIRCGGKELGVAGRRMELDRRSGHVCIHLAGRDPALGQPRHRATVAIPFAGGPVLHECLEAGAREPCRASFSHAELWAPRAREPDWEFRLRNGAFEKRTPSNTWTPYARLPDGACSTLSGGLGSEQRRSPSGRYVVVGCNPEGASSPAEPLLFDKAAGTLLRADHMPDLERGSWLRRSDILVVDDTVIIPGFGSFRAGLVAY